jgi:hypothetical protein
VSSRHFLQVTIARPDYYDAGNHEAASKFLGQENFRLNIQQRRRAECNRLVLPETVGETRLPQERPMKKLLLALLLIATPACAQTKLTPKDTIKGATARADNCAPIGRTATGELVYSMKCENLPASPPPQAENREAPPLPAESPVQRSGLFGWSYEVKRPDQ